MQNNYYWQHIIDELERNGFHTIAYEVERAWSANKKYIIPEWLNSLPKILKQEIDNVNFNMSLDNV